MNIRHAAFVARVFTGRPAWLVMLLIMLGWTGFVAFGVPTIWSFYARPPLSEVIGDAERLIATWRAAVLGAAVLGTYVALCSSQVTSSAMLRLVPRLRSATAAGIVAATCLAAAIVWLFLGAIRPESLRVGIAAVATTVFVCAASLPSVFRNPKFANWSAALFLVVLLWPPPFLMLVASAPVPVAAVAAILSATILAANFRSAEWRSASLEGLDLSESPFKSKAAPAWPFTHAEGSIGFFIRASRHEAQRGGKPSPKPVAIATVAIFVFALCSLEQLLFGVVRNSILLIPFIALGGGNLQPSRTPVFSRAIRWRGVFRIYTRIVATPVVIASLIGELVAAVTRPLPFAFTLESGTAPVFLGAGVLLVAPLAAWANVARPKWFMSRAGPSLRGLWLILPIAVAGVPAGDSLESMMHALTPHVGPIGAAAAVVAIVAATQVAFRAALRHHFERADLLAVLAR
jgi:hypothetical protein